MEIETRASWALLPRRAFGAQLRLCLCSSFCSERSATAFPPTFRNARLQPTYLSSSLLSPNQSVSVRSAALFSPVHTGDNTSYLKECSNKSSKSMIIFVDTESRLCNSPINSGVDFIVTVSGIVRTLGAPPRIPRECQCDC